MRVMYVLTYSVTARLVAMQGLQRKSTVHVVFVDVFRAANVHQLSCFKRYNFVSCIFCSKTHVLQFVRTVVSPT